MRLQTQALRAGLCAALLAAAVPVRAGKPAKPAAKPAGKAPAKPAAKAGAGDEARLQALEAKLKKSPGDAKLKQQVAEASYKAGHYIEYDKPGLSPREKYRPALKLYRRALELNPKHALAAKEKDQIEAIYKQMGMPVPQ
jgi:hypothetical protein